jgi:hypothetical protein
VHTGVGLGLIVGASLLSFAVGFGLRGRTPAALSIGLAAFAGGALAAGALLVQPHASAGDWILAVGALMFLWPIHIRVVLGPYGLKDSRLLAEEAPGA